MSAAHWLPALPSPRARAIIERFPSACVLVVGDVMLDRFVVGRVTRISPEAPVPVVLHDHDEVRLGGAANVAHNVASLGGRVRLIGVIGPDEDGRVLRTTLAERQLETSGLVTAADRRTTTKVRVVTTRNQQVARIDYETEQPLSVETEAAVLGAMDDAVSDARVLVASDYRKGVLSHAVMRRLVTHAQTDDRPLLADPKVPDLRFYAGASCLTPNHLEAEAAVGFRIQSHEDARRAARAIIESAQVQSVLVTLGERGLWLTHPEGEGAMAATAREVSDVTGAGDTVLATLALATAAGAAPHEAAALANAAAGIVVARFGAATVCADDLRALFPD
jgi:D-beta-D-heptose 7-phosphate kinase/D-beta-D-heptose 1-phosphate adenosyltransferase